MVLMPGCGCCASSGECPNNFPPCSIVGYQPDILGGYIPPGSQVVPTSTSFSLSVVKNGAYTWNSFGNSSPTVYSGIPSSMSLPYNYKDGPNYIYRDYSQFDNWVACRRYQQDFGKFQLGCSCEWNYAYGGLFSFTMTYRCAGDGEATTVIGCRRPYQWYGPDAGFMTIESNGVSLTSTTNDANYLGQETIIQGSAVPFRVFGRNSRSYRIDSFTYAWQTVEWDFTVVSAPPVEGPNPLP
jgi:hypothetical protein